MRLNTLELIRYGRFSGQTLDFPRADCDFHLIVGPNEAGKSTLRRAVSELLFGMPLRSDMDFVHPLADLRLGAVIESEAGTLAFHRARGRKSLRRPDDAVLPDNALVEHLGGTSALMFNRMFGLDLTGLIEGGQSILDASDDVGQLLFQSAAGLSTLGTVRDELGKEADSLFAPRKSADRAFYKALTLHDEARQTLRGLTVNVRQWNAVSAQVDAAQVALAQAVQQYAALSATRQQLERVRRIAPRVAQWRDAREQLQALAGAVELPANAAQRLAEAEAAIAAQSATLTARTEALAGWQAQLAELAPQLDDAVLTQAAAIDALAAQGHACAGHPPKIARAEQEVAALLRDAAQAAHQLGWPESETALRARVPASLALKTLAGLLQERAGLQQAQQSAQEAHARAKAVMARLQPSANAPRPAAHAATSAGESATLALFPGDPAPAEPSSPVPSPISPAPVSASHVSPSHALAGALQDALAFKGSAARQRGLQLAQAQAEANLHAALAALGPWRMDVAALAGLALPGDDALASLKAERTALFSAADMARQQVAQAQEKARQSKLSLTQFAHGRAVVTPDDVKQARAERDALWARIKHEDEPLRAAAPRLDQAIGEADRRVDLQRDHAEESARLLSLQQEQARDAAAAQAAEQRQVEAARALEDFEARWSARAQAAGLQGMALLDLGGWMGQRRVALDAAAAVQGRAAELAAETDAEAAALGALRAALRASGAPDVEHRPLAELCARAQQYIDAHQAALAGAQARADQQAAASAELEHQARALAASEAKLAAWQSRWGAALAMAALDGAWMKPDAAQGAIDLAGDVLQALARVDAVRRQQIQAMQQDLADFEAAARALHHALGRAEHGGADTGGAETKDAKTQGAESSGAGDADAFTRVQALAQQVRRAQAAQQAHQRLVQQQHAGQAQAQAAATALAATRASLQSLYQQAGSDDHAALRARIAQSDRHRALSAEVERHRQDIVEQGDGLSLDALLAACDGVAPETLKPQLDELDAQLLAVVDQRSQRSTELAQAQAELGRIHGGADAATAESRRLEALAQMGEAAERYVTVATGHRLLRWAIDRYRERKQGPLLQRAGALFARLTLGGFARLAPDFETQPPRLIAVRASGERVGIEGLSEGTRDQLFLALRLAALEMHIAADRPLPFIADDLFVNFHDSRSLAGLAALGDLARKTQVIFLTHHAHLVDVARESIGPDVHVIELDRD